MKHHQDLTHKNNPGTSSEVELKLARKRASTVEKYPLPSIKAKPRPQNRVVAVVQHEGMVLLRKRPKTGLLAGQWEFPALTVEENQAKKETLSAPEDERREQACIEILASRKIKSRESVGLVTHTFSHLKHFMYVDIVKVESKNIIEEHEERWFEFEKLCTLLNIPRLLFRFGFDVRSQKRRLIVHNIPILKKSTLSFTLE